MEKKQYYFIEYEDGSIQKFEGELDPATLNGEIDGSVKIEAAYTVATVYSKKSVFQATELVGKPERRIRMADGSLKLKSEMTEEEKAWYSGLRKAAATRAAASRKANAAN